MKLQIESLQEARDVLAQVATAIVNNRACRRKCACNVCQAQEHVGAALTLLARELLAGEVESEKARTA